MDVLKPRGLTQADLDGFKPAIENNPYNVQIKTDISKDYRQKGGPVRQTVGINSTPSPLIDKNRITKGDIFPTKNPKSVTLNEGWRDDFGRSYGDEGRWRPAGGSGNRPSGGRPGGGMGGPGGMGAGGGGVATQTMPTTNPIVQSLNNSFNNSNGTSANYGLQTPSGTIQNLRDIHQPATKPKTSPIFDPKPASPGGVGAGAVGAGAVGAGKALTQSQIARGGALITGLGIVQSASLGFQIGASIADFINFLDPAGEKFLRDYFNEEVDKPKNPNSPTVPTPPFVPDPSPTRPPYNPISSEISREFSISGVSATGYAKIVFPNGSSAIEEPSYGIERYFETIDGKEVLTTKYIPRIKNREPAEYYLYTGYGNYTIDFKETTWVTLDVTRFEDQLSGGGWGLDWRYFTFIRVRLRGRNYFFENDTEWFYPWQDFYAGPDPLWWDGFRWVRTAARQFPSYASSNISVIFDDGRTPTQSSPNPQGFFPKATPPPYEVDSKNPFQEQWFIPGIWREKQEDDDMGCDLSPVIAKLNSQTKQITNLQNTVNNISINSSINSSNIQNINANTTTVVNNAINSINSNTNSVVNTATNAINSNTNSVVNTATNAINSNTNSVVNSAANSINSNTSSVVSSATNAINNNIANLSSKLTQVADDIILGVKNNFALLEAWLKPALNGLEQSLKTVLEAVTKLSERFNKFLKWIHFDRVLNLMILISTIHNAAMLSNQLGSSLVSMVNSLLTAGGNALGLRSVDDEPIDIAPALSGAFDNFVMGFIGKEGSTELKKQWNKYNRIYQAAANLLGNIQSLNQSILSAMEIVGGNVARIGNALRKWGEVSESAFNWMNPQPFFSNPFSRFAEKAQQGIEQTDSVAQETIGAQQQVSQIQKEIDDFKELLNKEEKVGIPAPTPAKTTATETEAKTNSTAGATPLLISEKQ